MRTVTHVKSANACALPPHEVFSKATRHKRGKGLLRTDCPRGQFWDPNGYCWSCPKGYTRTAYPVTHKRACTRWVGAKQAKATLVKSLACPDGSFFDPINGGTCWSCPQGFVRTLSPVTALDACAANLLAGIDPVLGVCERGLVNIRGTCERVGVCGKKEQRPCLIGERIPSCNDGLKENFKQNILRTATTRGNAISCRGIVIG